MAHFTIRTDLNYVVTGGSICGHIAGDARAKCANPDEHQAGYLISQAADDYRPPQQ